MSSNLIEKTTESVLEKVVNELEQQVTMLLSQINYCEDLEATSSTLIDYLSACKSIIQSYLKKDRSITLVAENTKQEIEKQMTMFYRNIEKLVKVQELSGNATERMHEIHTTNQQIMDDFKKALTFLNDISRSTRVLSINSSIEAARLGEMGGPFKVISKEVQTLSDTTSKAATAMTGSTEKITDQSIEMEEMFSHTHATLEEAVTDLLGAKSGFQTMHVETEDIVRESIVLDDVLVRSLEFINKCQSMIHYNKVSYSNIKNTMVQQVENTEKLLAELRQSMSNVEPPMHNSNDFQTLQKNFHESFKDENKNRCIEILHSLLNQGHSPEILLNQVVERAVEKIGKEQIERDVPLSEIYMNGRIIEESLDILLPLITAKSDANIGKIVIGNAFGDYHALGRQIVTTFLRLAGFEVIDLGLSVSNEEFVRVAKQEDADLICVSALIIHTAKEVKELRSLLDRSGLKAMKIVVGGAPFNFEPRLVKEVHADGMAENAIEAIRVAKEMIG